MGKNNLIRAALLSCGGLIVAAIPAAAQDYGAPYNAPGYQRDTSEEIVIEAPRHRERSEFGAPIRTEALSRPVRFDDLDLSTPYGAHELRDRVRYTARALCRELDRRYPITVSDGQPDCYRAAVDDAMYQADRAIDDARTYPD